MGYLEPGNLKPGTLSTHRLDMVSFSLLTLALATISAYANPTARAVGDLDVSLSSPVDKVASVSELRIVATVKNIGDKDLKILKSGTVLDNQHPTRSFTVRKDGKEADFTGVKVCSYLLRCRLLDIHIDGSHSFSPPWITSPRKTGLSSQPARL